MELDYSILWENPDPKPQHAPERTETPIRPRQAPYPIQIYPSEKCPSQRTPDPSEREQLFLQAYRIISDYKQKRAAAEGIMRQIEKDIGKKDPLTLLLLAAEALDRMSGGGDRYIKRLQQKARSAGGYES